MNPILPLKQRFFSSDELGVVIISDDFVRLGQKMGFELAKKSTETLLIEIIKYIKATKNEQNFAKFSSKMVEERASDLISLIKPYKFTQQYYSKHLEKASAFAKELKEGVNLE